MLIVREASIVSDWPCEGVTVTWQAAGEAVSPAGFACNVRFAGALPAVGLRLSQLADGQPVTEAVKGTDGADPTGAGALIATVLSNGVLLPCSTLKDTVAGDTVKWAGLTVKASDTVSEFEACADAMDTLQL